MIIGIDINFLDVEVLDVLEFVMERIDLEFFLFRGGNIVYCLFFIDCKYMLYKRIFVCLLLRNLDLNCVEVKVYVLKEKDYFVWVLIIFDGRLYLEVVKVL